MLVDVGVKPFYPEHDPALFLILEVAYLAILAEIAQGIGGEAEIVGGVFERGHVLSWSWCPSVCPHWRLRAFRPLLSLYVFLSTN